MPDLDRSPPPPTLADRWRGLSRSYLRAAAGGLLGAAAGAAYAHFVGCQTGTCPLTASVWTAGTYGGLVGVLVGWPTRARAAADKGADPQGSA